MSDQRCSAGWFVAAGKRSSTKTASYKVRRAPRRDRLSGPAGANPWGGQPLGGPTPGGPSSNPWGGQPLWFFLPCGSVWFPPHGSFSRVVPSSRFSPACPPGQAIDPCLSEVGVQQAEAAGHYLRDVTFTNVFVSTMLRARQVGAVIVMHIRLCYYIVLVHLFRHLVFSKSFLSQVTSRALITSMSRITLCECFCFCPPPC